VIYLLDTHILLWGSNALGTQNQLPIAAQNIIENFQNTLYFSAASIWEIAIKSALGRPDFLVNPQVFRAQLIDNGFTELAISAQHAAAVGNLPLMHKDSFDRLLLSQAMVEGTPLVTADHLLIALVNQTPGLPIQPV
jgi:PIN domain nuclease of toxin-antitoxin system